MLCCGVLGGNPYLAFHCASQGTVLIDLAPDDKEFQSVEEEVHTHTHILSLTLSLSLYLSLSLSPPLSVVL